VNPLHWSNVSFVRKLKNYEEIYNNNEVHIVAIYGLDIITALSYSYFLSAVMNKKSRIFEYLPFSEECSFFESNDFCDKIEDFLKGTEEECLILNIDKLIKKYIYFTDENKGDMFASLLILKARLRDIFDSLIRSDKKSTIFIPTTNLSALIADIFSYHRILGTLVVPLSRGAHKDGSGSFSCNSNFFSKDRYKSSVELFSRSSMYYQPVLKKIVDSSLGLHECSDLPIDACRMQILNLKPADSFIDHSKYSGEEIHLLGLISDALWLSHYRSIKFSKEQVDTTVDLFLRCNLDNLMKGGSFLMIELFRALDDGLERMLFHLARFPEAFKSLAPFLDSGRSYSKSFFLTVLSLNFRVGDYVYEFLEMMLRSAAGKTYYRELAFVIFDREPCIDENWDRRFALLFNTDVFIDEYRFNDNWVGPEEGFLIQKNLLWYLGGASNTLFSPPEKRKIVEASRVFYDLSLTHFPEDEDMRVYLEAIWTKKNRS
jgi:hypothetical protein